MLHQAEPRTDSCQNYATQIDGIIGTIGAVIESLTGELEGETFEVFQGLEGVIGSLNNVIGDLKGLTDNA